MRQTILTLSKSFGAVLVLASVVGAGSDYRVVAHPKVPVASLTRSELARIFMKTTATWSDGSAIVPLDQDRTSAVRDSFSRAVHNRDADGIAAHWQTLVFAGRAVPPAVKKSDAEVLEAVRSTPGAVGYVSATASLEGVKTLTVR